MKEVSGRLKAVLERAFGQSRKPNERFIAATHRILKPLPVERPIEPADDNEALPNLKLEEDQSQRGGDSPAPEPADEDIKPLFQEGANSNTLADRHTQFIDCCFERNADRVKQMLEAEQTIVYARDATWKRNGFHWACERQRESLVLVFLQDPRIPRDILTATDDDRQTAWHIVADEGKSTILRLLSSNGDLLKMVNHQDLLGQTALHCACEGGHLEAVRFLLELQVDPDHADLRQRAPLHLAAANNRADIIRLLHQKAAGEVKWERADRFGDTALHMAAERGNVEAIRALLEFPDLVNLEALNENNFTALDLASGESAALLRAAASTEPRQKKRRVRD